jgi:hypothetical protein
MIFNKSSGTYPVVLLACMKVANLTISSFVTNAINAAPPISHKNARPFLSRSNPWGADNNYFPRNILIRRVPGRRRGSPFAHCTAFPARGGQSHL